MQDLSSLARDSVWPTSQAAGFTMSVSNEKALTAPGSQPVNPGPGKEELDDPTVDVPAAKGPAVTKGPGGYSPSPVAWKKAGNG